MSSSYELSHLLTKIKAVNMDVTQIYSDLNYLRAEKTDNGNNCI